MKKEVLGIKVDDVTIDQAVEMVLTWLSKKGKYYITTPNPEIVMMAQRDQELKNIINKADLSIPDGVGLKLSGNIVNTTRGVDLMEELITASSKPRSLRMGMKTKQGYSLPRNEVYEADVNLERKPRTEGPRKFIKRLLDYGFTIGLLGGKTGVADKAAERLRIKYPGIKIIFAESGGEIDEGGKSLESLDSIKSLKIDILFVAFGPPKQEKWIAKNLNKIPVKVAMGVGGSFDYLSGNIPRAPYFLRELGLEWLFRLILQPWRIRRQLVLVDYLFKLLTKSR